MHGAKLLTNDAMRAFISDGRVTITPDLPVVYHEHIFHSARSIYATAGNPGNAIYESIPDLPRLFASPAIRGALESILGPDYFMHPHRHGHLNTPGTAAQPNHQDSYEEDENVRHHRTRWAMLFYYPQNVSQEMGPTAVTPGSHRYYREETIRQMREIAVTGNAGTVTIVHYDLWHRALENRSDRNRFMLKFLFGRMKEPESPSWKVIEDGLDRRDDRDRREESLADRTLWRWHCGGDHHSDFTDAPETSAEVGDAVEQLRAPSESVQMIGAYLLGALGERAVPETVDFLKWEAMEKSEINLRADHTNPSQLVAGCALAAIGSPAVPALCSLLADSRWPVRAAAADILGDIAAGGDSSRYLTEALGDENEWVRRNAAEALGSIGDVSATPSLCKSLSDHSLRVRHNAALALAKIGPGAEDSVTPLRKALGDSSPYVRSNAALALDRIDVSESSSGDATEPALPV